MMTSLQTKQVQVFDACHLCGTGVETTAHSLVQCLFTKMCWSSVLPGFDCSVGTDFMTWFQMIMDKHKDKVELVAVVCWGIWKARNDVVWNNTSPRTEMVVVLQIQLRRLEILNIGVNQSSMEIHCTEATGIREALSWIKEYTEKREVGENGQAVSFVVETDCLIAVQVIKNAVPIFSPFGKIIAECRSLLLSLENVFIQFVKRSVNKVADWLAHFF